MRFVILLVALMPFVADAAELRVISVSGEVLVADAGQTRTVHMGDGLKTPLVVTTGSGASVQIRVDDGAQVSVGENTEIHLNETKQSLALVRGQMALWSNENPWVIDAAGSLLRSRAYLRLRICTDECTLRHGVYGKGSAGELVVEYTGGRSVLRDRLFLIPAAGGKPELLPRDSGFLSSMPRFDAAVAAKQAMAQEIRKGLDAFKSSRYDEAKEVLTRVRRIAPGEVVISYYLALIALEQQRNSDALREFQRYAKEDVEGAREREVQKLLTLLTTAELQQEVALAIQQETTITAALPEPGSIAVQTFGNRGTAASSALAKGIAAMIITDLGKVPGLKVLERQKVQKIIDEIRLSASGLVETDSAVRAGRLLRAERVVVGSMGVEQ